VKANIFKTVRCTV